MGKVEASAEHGTSSSSRREEEVRHFLSLEGFDNRVAGTTVALYFSSLPSKLRKIKIHVHGLVFFSVKKYFNCIKETLLQTL